MNEPDEEIRAGTRRGFLHGAGVAAGAAALLGAEPSARAQAAKGQPAAPERKNRRDRASAPADRALTQLGPLRDLGGVWVGTGFNLISLPDFDNPEGPQPFRVKLNSTHETLEFQPIGGNVPNRGSTGQKDINIFGFTYLQRISDRLSNGALHVEPGLWLHVPATSVPAQPETVVRQGSIPHGTSVLAQGAVVKPLKTPPHFHAVDSTPFNAKGPITGPAYLAPFDQATLPPGFGPPFLKNPNLALEAAIVGQNIVSTEVLSVSTKGGGGLVNIPFLVANANAMQLDAIFWIETVEQPDGTQFMQLQYTQTVILSFLNISWPHISVATLVKQ